MAELTWSLRSALEAAILSAVLDGRGSFPSDSVEVGSTYDPAQAQTVFWLDAGGRRSSVAVPDEQVWFALDVAPLAQAVAGQLVARWYGHARSTAPNDVQPPLAAPVVMSSGALLRPDGEVDGYVLVTLPALPSGAAYADVYVRGPAGERHEFRYDGHPAATLYLRVPPAVPVEIVIRPYSALGSPLPRSAPCCVLVRDVQDELPARVRREWSEIRTPEPYGKDLADGAACRAMANALRAARKGR